jgi:pyruvate, orthophosphate dikinase
MVFGNMGDDCATGVAFTRNPSTGENSFYGEYLINAQGEDVVAGIRTPQNITKKARLESGSKDALHGRVDAKVYKELVTIYKKLEKHYRDMQDIEFTVENKKLWMLQTRSGKRTAKASIKIAVDMVKEKLITKDEALLKNRSKNFRYIIAPNIRSKS